MENSYSIPCADQGKLQVVIAFLGLLQTAILTTRSFQVKSIEMVSFVVTVWNKMA